ncbi:hypothetical protein DET0613 [Dehalococcoides mccartyi 195]|uniref:Uncharacterized protein n=1 Tax=Dehalococcoides mccartyi (strain ATCC BAA-2266 / KCTC 15142 / 195) TaxID=243164 RepID=Q3Z8U4_DEHM1|nr:hypothetical protein DET0613 [Dehalococcoides mccartyi 195]
MFCLVINAKLRVLILVVYIKIPRVNGKNVF